MALDCMTIAERLTQLEMTMERQEPLPPKIQRVAHHLSQDTMHYEKHYTPKIMSLGPIHYGVPKLQLGEQYKQMWAAMYIRSTGQAPQTLYRKIQDNIEELKSLFAADLFTETNPFRFYSRQGFTNLEEMMCWTLLVDGCALLQILENAHDQPNKMNVKVEQLFIVMQDVLLLENQLPYLLLKLLWRDTHESHLIETMEDFLRCHHWATRDEDKVNVSTQFPPTHLLDLQRYIVLYDPSPNNENQTQNYPNDETDMVTYRNIMELKAAGIELKSSKTRRAKDVSFSHGWLRSKLTLPEIIVNDTTAAYMLNLIAYEMCPDFENDYGIRSYVSFLNSLIDHPDDVKALKSERILLNSLGSDEEVVKLFATMSYNLMPQMGKYASVRAQIERHFHHKTLPTGLALGYNTYFNNPWAIIAFLAAVLALPSLLSKLGVPFTDQIPPNNYK